MVREKYLQKFLHQSFYLEEVRAVLEKVEHLDFSQVADETAPLTRFSHLFQVQPVIREHGYGPGGELAKKNKAMAPSSIKWRHLCATYDIFPEEVQCMAVPQAIANRRRAVAIRLAQSIEWELDPDVVGDENVFACVLEGDVLREQAQLKHSDPRIVRVSVDLTWAPLRVDGDWLKEVPVEIPSIYRVGLFDEDAD